MADDAVPIPLDLKLPQYAFQLQDESLSKLHDNAAKSFWASIEKNEMAPYMATLPSTIKPPSADLYTELKNKNEDQLKKIEAKVKDAEESLGEIDVSEPLREKAGYLVTIGDKDNALAAIDVALEKTAGVGARIDLVLAKIRLGMFFNDNSLIDNNIKTAQDLIEKGGDWDRRNRLKVYSAVHFLSIRKFQEAANLFLDCLSTFTATELMEYDDFVALTVVATGVGCDRAGIKTKVLNNAEINSLMPQMPALATFTKTLYECNYAEFFTSLAEVEETYLTPVPILAPHARYYVREMRIKAYKQILESYKSLTIERMSKAFGISTTFLDSDLSRFISNGRLACTIDKVSGVITTTKTSAENKTVAYEQVVKQGDVLLNEISKLSRIIG